MGVSLPPPCPAKAFPVDYRRRRFATPAQEARIDAKANRILARKGKTKPRGR